LYPISLKGEIADRARSENRQRHFALWCFLIFGDVVLLEIQARGPVTGSGGIPMRPSAAVSAKTNPGMPTAVDLKVAVTVGASRMGFASANGDGGLQEKTGGNL